MKRRPSTVRMGPISVFALVIILCLAVLGVLAASTAQAGSALAERQASFAEDEYRNEVAGQALYAQADVVLEPVRQAGGDEQDAAEALSESAETIAQAAAEAAAAAGAGTMDEGTANAPDPETGSADGASASPSGAPSAPTVSASVDGTTLSAHIQAASGRCLDIVWEMQDDATLSVASWKATTLWTEDTTDVLWTGGAL